MGYFTTILIAGFVGGILRGIVGYVKYQTKFKDIKFRIWYFLGMTGISGVVGLLAAWVIKDLGISFLGFAQLPASVAFIIGYAGGDFIENAYKIITQKTSIYPNL